LYKFYEYPPSGNSYKVKLLLTQLGLPFESVPLDILKGETRTPEFYAKNPNGRIPVLELDDGRTLCESSAILWYLADGSQFLPAEAWSQAKVLQWLAFEQYSLEPNIAVARYWLKYAGKSEEELGKRLKVRRKAGVAALALLNDALASTEFLVDDQYSIADIGLFAYTHVAADGGFPLNEYHNILAWIERLRSQPRFVPMVTRWP
jgi:glutathione S-transferase